MKNSNKIIVLMLGVNFIFSCATVKMSDTWKSDKFNTIKNEKILVVSKSKDINVSKSYEKEIANRLRENGVDAIERHLKYPTLTDNLEQTKEDIDKIVAKFRLDGINGIVVTALKDVKVKTKIIKEGGYVPYSTYSDKAFISFRAYIDNINTLNKLPAMETVETTTILESKTYFLEAVTYNLSLEGDKQLVGVLQADVVDPENAKNVLKEFSKIVSKQFK